VLGRPRKGFIPMLVDTALKEERRMRLWACGKSNHGGRGQLKDLPLPREPVLQFSSSCFIGIKCGKAPTDPCINSITPI
jgi:hypothetical protein